MRRFRLNTLMLLTLIAALSVALVVQQRQAARREAELQALISRLDAQVFTYKRQEMEREAASAAKTTGIDR